MKLRHVQAAVYGRPWFVLPDTLATIDEIVRLHVAGGRLEPDEIADRLTVAAAGNGPRRGAQRAGAVAVIPIYGVIMPRATLMTEMSGGATVQGIRASFRQALEDDSVASILFDVDSPGGSVEGIEELATEIREARGRKPMGTIAHYTMASAAYYLGSQADEIVASPSAMVGWIGTLMIHTEYSKQDEAEGITRTVIRNPPGKSLVNAVEPLSDDARAQLQRDVDDFSNQFVNAVAKGRGVSAAVVRAEFGAGGGMTAARAKAAGLVDRVESFDAVVRRMAAGRGPVARGAAALADDAPYLAFAESANDQGGDDSPADDPEATTSGEAGTPPAPEPVVEDDAATDHEPVTTGASQDDDLELRKLRIRSRSRE